MKKAVWTAALCVGLAGLVSEARAAKELWTDTVSFTSDLELPKVLTVPTFDTMGGTRILQNVEVTFLHSGGAEPAGDNDDPFQGAEVRARVVRNWSANGPGVFANGNETVTSPFTTLLPDDNDGGNNDTFDPPPADGVDFGVLGYSDLGAMAAEPRRAAHDLRAVAYYKAARATAPVLLAMQGVDHAGNEMDARMPDAFLFIERRVNPPAESPSLEPLRKEVERLKRSAGLSE